MIVSLPWSREVGGGSKVEIVPLRDHRPQQILSQMIIPDDCITSAHAE